MSWILDANSLILTSPTPAVEVPKEIPYKFEEGRILEELKSYIAGTYAEHYSSKDGTQTFELIVSSDNAKGFTMGSIMKYASRYGKKNGFNRKDILKILHYAMLALYVHDKEHPSWAHLQNANQIPITLTGIHETKE